MTGVLKINVGACVGCKRCEIQCAVAHSESKELLASILEDPLSRPRIHVMNMGGWPVPNQCRHCQDAPCIDACPEGALYREGPDKPVLHDPSKCKGHRECEKACPFHAIEITEDGRLFKCDLCIERLQDGLQPACAEGCPVNAIEFDTEHGAQEKGAIALPVGAGLAQYEIIYDIAEEACKGCQMCVKGCPVSGISGEPKEVQHIDHSKCITCGECFRRCRLNAVVIKTAAVVA